MASGNPITRAQQERDKAIKSMEKMQIKLLDLQAENDQLRRVIAGIDTRLDMQLMFFHKVMDNAGTLSEAKSWWNDFVGEIGVAEMESGTECSVEKAREIRAKHGLHWDDEWVDELRVQKNIEWFGSAR